jgi:hypothetical protein
LDDMNIFRRLDIKRRNAKRRKIRAYRAESAPPAPPAKETKPAARRRKASAKS